MGSATGRAWIKSFVDRAVGIYPADMIAGIRAAASTAQSGKEPTDYNLAIGLNSDHVDNVARARIEDRVKRAVRVQPPDVFACGCAGAATAKIGKSSTDY